MNESPINKIEVQEQLERLNLVSRVTKTFKDCMSYRHVLPRHHGHCKQPHGHNASLEITICGKVKPLIIADEWPQSVNYEKWGYPGMIVDFQIIKNIVKSQIIDQLDHTDWNQSVPMLIDKTINDFKDSNGITMIIDAHFDRAKIMMFDHLIITYLDRIFRLLEKLKQFPPTCEIVANVIFICLHLYFTQYINRVDDQNFLLDSIKLYETESSFCTVSRDILGA